MLFIKELWRYFMLRKKFWLLPVLIVLTLLGSLIIATQGTVIAPFIYTLF